MNPAEAFIRADSALNGVIQQIRDDQWGMAMPAGFLRRDPEKPVTLREIINYHAYDEAWIPYMFAGRTMDEVGPTTFDGDLLGDDPRASFDALVSKARREAQSLSDLDAVIHFSYGDFPVRDGIWHVTSFRALRAVDLARVIGVDDQLDPALVVAMWDELEPQAEMWRSIGVFPPQVEVAEDAPLQERLLGLTGRQTRR